MNKSIDWVIAGVIGALMLVAEFQAVFYETFEPLQLAVGIALLLLVRVIHFHAPRLIAAKYPPQLSAAHRVTAAYRVIRLR